MFGALPGGARAPPPARPGVGRSVESQQFFVLLWLHSCPGSVETASVATGYLNFKLALASCCGAAARPVTSLSTVRAGGGGRRKEEGTGFTVPWGADFCLGRRTGQGAWLPVQAAMRAVGLQAVAGLQLKPVTWSRRECLWRWGIYGSAGSVLATQSGQLQPSTPLCPLTARGYPSVEAGRRVCEGGRLGKNTLASVIHSLHPF